MQKMAAPPCRKRLPRHAEKVCPAMQKWLPRHAENGYFAEGGMIPGGLIILYPEREPL